MNLLESILQLGMHVHIPTVSTPSLLTKIEEGSQEQSTHNCIFPFFLSFFSRPLFKFSSTAPPPKGVDLYFTHQNRRDPYLIGIYYLEKNPKTICHIYYYLIRSNLVDFEHVLERIFIDKISIDLINRIYSYLIRYLRPL